jgi:hypothetical protein
MSTTAEQAASGPPRVAAGALAPWEVADLPLPPRPGWRLWVGLLGPGIVLAGTSIGTGEWIFGPAVTAQFGATLLWLASLSIVLQVFINLIMMRYAVYCGEPIIVGGLRTRPGPAFWISCYAAMDLVGGIWPFNAANAAVPLVAAALGYLPGDAESFYVKVAGYGVFLLCFVPLIFGGTVYRMLEKVMAFKLVYVLGFLSLVTVLMVQPSVAWEVFKGFCAFGEVPIRADTVIAGRHFNMLQEEGDVAYRLRGTMENDKGPSTEFRVKRSGETQTNRLKATIAEFSVKRGGETRTYRLKDRLPEELLARREAMVARASALAKPGTFLVETHEAGARLEAQGTIGPAQRWIPSRLVIENADGVQTFRALDQVPEPYAAHLEGLIAHKGLERVGFLGYTMQHGQPPPFDWPTLAAFFAVAGAGALANSLFSNYARDKGWGMGTHVGAIPSAIGGRTITLSHTGKVFPLDPSNLERWAGWMRHIRRDQMVWTIASFVGMALPCMLSLELIRNATVESNGVAAMMARGMAERYPDYGRLLWFLTLFCGFLVLAPGQVSVGDQIARRWTDIIWATNARVRSAAGNQVKLVYYGILGLYCLFGLVTLAIVNPLQIAKISTIIGNIALAFSAIQALHANRTLLPRQLQPSWFLQCGVVACAVFFLGITLITVVYLL